MSSAFISFRAVSSCGGSARTALASCAGRSNRRRLSSALLETVPTRKLSPARVGGASRRSLSTTTTSSSSSSRSSRKANSPVRGVLAQLDDVLLDDLPPMPSFLCPSRTVALIGAPMQYGQPVAGVEQAPQLMRDAGLHDVVMKLGWRLENMGDIPMSYSTGVGTASDPTKMQEGKALQSLSVGAGNHTLATTVHKAAAAGRFVLTIGGDHSIAIGTLAGLLATRSDTGVLWVDAHADINTPASSPSGNMHGMPLGLLMRLCDPATIQGLEWLEEKAEVGGVQPSAVYPTLQPSQIAYIGLRDLDPSEKRLLRKMSKEMGMFVSTMQDVDRRGIGPCVSDALAHLTAGSRPLHLSFDIDALDPRWAPATGTMVRGGLTYREAEFVVEAAAETGLLGSMDLVEVNPSLAQTPEAKQRTLEMAMALCASGLGSTIL